MKIVLSIMPGEYKAYPQNELALVVDTDTGKAKFLDFDMPKYDDMSRIMGMTYTGNVLVLAGTTMTLRPHHMTRLIMIDVITGNTRGVDCPVSNAIHDMVSVYPGQLYVNSTDDDTMNNITINMDELDIIKDVVHYKLGDSLFDNRHFNSLFNYKNKWYASMFGVGWRNADWSHGEVFELSNNRTIYSRVKQPHTVFFNSDDRLCFCESGNGLFHFGDKVVDLKGYTRGVIEDRQALGYWVGISDTSRRKRTKQGIIVNDNIVGIQLVFVNYDGVIGKKIKLEKFGGEIYGIVPAYGYLSNEI